jgi:hypothetical protein
MFHRALDLSGLFGTTEAMENGHEFVFPIASKELS